MSGILEQAIQYLQTQQQAMQSMMGSGGGSSGGIGDLFPQTPMTGGGQTQSVSQPSTMEVPTPPVTAPPVTAPPVTTTPPVTNTTPVSTPPAPVSTPTPKSITDLPFTEVTTMPVPPPPANLGDLLKGIAPRRPQGTPQERFADTDIDPGFFDSEEYTQSQQGPQTMDMGYASDYGFGSGLSSSRGRAQDQAYEDYLKRTGQGDMITREQIAPTTSELPAFQQNFLDQIKQAQAGGQGIFGNLSQRPNNPMLDQRKKALGISGLGQMGLGGDPRFAGLGQMAGRPAGLGQMDQAMQMRLMQQAQMQMMKQGQALPAQQFVPQAQQPQPSSMAGMNLGVGLNPLFGRAFAGKPV
jgi:type II secretory pathway pseudopilin PulG